MPMIKKNKKGVDIFLKKYHIFTTHFVFIKENKKQCISPNQLSQQSKT